MEELFAAIRSGDAARVRALVEADPALASARDEAGLSAVLTALYHRQAEARDALLAADPELDVLDAAATGRLDVLRAIIESDQDALAARSPEGFTPLHLAAFFGGARAVRMLLAAGMPADADQENPARRAAAALRGRRRRPRGGRGAARRGRRPRRRPAGRLHAAARPPHTATTR